MAQQHNSSNSSATATTAAQCSEPSTAAVSVALAAAATSSDAPSPDSIYHIRTIQKWTPTTSTLQTDALDFTFYGLALELDAYRVHPSDSHELPTPITLPLAFTHAAQQTFLHRDASPLATLVGPFRIRVACKADAAADTDTLISNKRVLQAFAAVQPLNTLHQINNIRFIDSSSSVSSTTSTTTATTLAIYAMLLRTATRASLATPIELAFARHNHAAAIATIQPFAMRADVQAAQQAQLQAMLQHDAALPVAVQLKKLCLLQQLDYETEQHVLQPHVCAQLADVYATTIASGDWQAFACANVLWYVNKRSFVVAAEHPMRQSDALRIVLWDAQLTATLATTRLQRVVRTRQQWQQQRRQQTEALVVAAVDHIALLEALWDDLINVSCSVIVPGVRVVASIPPNDASAVTEVDTARTPLPSPLRREHSVCTFVLRTLPTQSIAHVDSSTQTSVRVEPQAAAGAIDERNDHLDDNDDAIDDGTEQRAWRTSLTLLKSTLVQQQQQQQQQQQRRTKQSPLRTTYKPPRGSSIYVSRQQQSDTAPFLFASSNKSHDEFEAMERDEHALPLLVPSSRTHKSSPGDRVVLPVAAPMRLQGQCTGANHRTQNIDDSEWQQPHRSNSSSNRPLIAFFAPQLDERDHQQPPKPSDADVAVVRLSATELAILRSGQHGVDAPIKAIAATRTQQQQQPCHHYPSLSPTKKLPYIVRRKR